MNKVVSGILALTVGLFLVGCGEEKSYTIEALYKKGDVWLSKEDNEPADGILREFYDNGSILKSEIKVSDGKYEGVRKSYYENGKVSAEVPYANGVRNGAAIYYHESGQISKKVTFQDDQKNGVESSYYKNGDILKEIPYDNGVINGTYVGYQPNKVKYFSVEFKDGKPTGGTITESEGTYPVPMTNRQFMTLLPDAMFGQNR